MDNFGLLAPYQDEARNEAVSVAASSKIISEKRNEANPRKMIIIRNISAAAASVITINLGATSAAANTGIVLRQYESFTDCTGEGYTCFQGTISGICADANGNLAVMER